MNWFKQKKIYVKKKTHFIYDLLRKLYDSDEGFTTFEVYYHLDLIIGDAKKKASKIIKSKEDKSKGNQIIHSETNLDTKNKKYAWVKKEFLKMSRSDAETVFFLDNTSKYHLSTFGLSTYIDYVELKEARKASMKAEEHAKIAIRLTLIALIISIAVSSFSISLMLWGSPQEVEIVKSSIDLVDENFIVNQSLNVCNAECTDLLNNHLVKT
ncbi:hypothetical protein GOV04_04475 [Candidatus Woesearchaeota archaeon]|nr:hypothetical protein [Candidatus Woesearchaeota archaeon]